MTTGDFPVDPNFLTVHKHTLHTFRQRLGVLKRRAIDDSFRIEHNEIRLETGTNQSTIAESESLRRQRGHLSDRFRQRQPVKLANVPPEHARISACATRM